MKDILHEAGLHSAAQMYASEYAEGKLSRREFLTRTTALGVSAAAAYGLIGLAAPAQAQEAKTGGMIRVAMEVKGTKDPRLAAHRQHLSRLAGISGPVQQRRLLRRPAPGKLGSQRGCDAIHAEDPPECHLEQWRALHRR